MERKTLPIASEGWPFIVGPAVIALGLRLLGHRRRRHDERPAFAGNRKPACHRYILGGLIQDIIARSRLPTSSI